MSLVARFERNTRGRDLIVGDIHGHFSKLEAALAAVGFDHKAGDRLFSVGDLVDRGPESMLALEWISRPWFHAVQGNHEEMAISWPKGHMDSGNYAANGGSWNIANLPHERAAVAQALATLPIAIELQTAAGLIGIVHADCPFSRWADFTLALDELDMSRAQRDSIIDQAQWSRERVMGADDTGIDGVLAVVVGHTPMERFTSLGNVLFIDTGAWLPGDRARDFCILDAATLRHACRPSDLNWERS